MSNTFGFCKKCGISHYLGEGNAREAALELMNRLEEDKRIDFDSDKADERFSTDYLFGKARGQMFGVLECENSAGEKVFLKAFSCQYNGVWELEGWVPPLFDVECYDKLVLPVDFAIKRLSRELSLLPEDSFKRKVLLYQRREMSQKLMQDIHTLYELNNFAGEKASIYNAFLHDKGIPTGSGDCCAPKLLNAAARQRLKPLGLVEFYWGKANRSMTRTHGEFYSCCESKCQPILGFMLCGLYKEEVSEVE
jgi:hypothetical protein